MAGRKAQKTEAPQYDVFFSYAWKNKTAADAVVQALRDVGLRVWVDESELRKFDNITEGLLGGLSQSKVLVSYFSATYPTRRICQWELTGAYIAGQVLGTPGDRVVVLNPEGSRGHIPADMRVNLYMNPEQDAGFALEVKRHVARFDDALGSGTALKAPAWFPFAPLPWPRFKGRLRELWAIHSGLNRNEQVGIHGEPAAHELVQVRGFRGVGKSLLAEEYALRFGATYPGGVHWLRGGDGSQGTRVAQLATIAELRGIAVGDLSGEQLSAVIGGELDSAEVPSLWIVDGLPDGLSADQVRGWMGPGRWSKTLLTTVSRRYPHGATVDLAELEPDCAVELVCERGGVTGDVEGVRDLVAQVGCHPLACEVLGSWLKFSGVDETRKQLDSRDSDALEFAAEFADELPHGQSSDVSSILFASVARLSDAARDLLRVASVVANTAVSKDLVRDVFKAIGRSRNEADAALKEALDLSLARLVGEEEWAVHPLICRVVRFRDSGDRWRLLERCTLRVLLDRLRELEHKPGRVSAGMLVEHARTAGSSLESELHASVLSWVAWHDCDRGFFKDAIAMEKKILEARRRYEGVTAQSTLVAQNSLGEALRKASRLDEAKKVHQETLDLRTKTLGPDHGDTLQSEGNLLLVISEQGDRREAMRREERLLVRRQKSLGEDDPDTLIGMRNLGMLCLELGDTERALELVEEAWSRQRRTLGPGHRSSLKTQICLVEVERTKGNLDRSRQLLEELLEIGSDEDQDHPDMITARNSLALVAAAEGDLDEARRQAENVMESTARRLGETHHLSLKARCNLAVIKIQQRELESAEDDLRRVLRVALDSVGGDDQITLNIRGFLGRVLIDLEKADEAVEVLKAARETLTRRDGELDPRHVAIVRDLGIANMVEGKLEQAKGCLIEFRGLATQIWGKNNAEVAGASLLIAKALYDLGRLEDAKEELERSIPRALEGGRSSEREAVSLIGQLRSTLRAMGREREWAPWSRIVQEIREGRDDSDGISQA